MINERLVSTCQGKTQYVTPKEAHQVMARRVKRRGKLQGRGSMKAYKCGFCKAWHVGSNPF